MSVELTERKTVFMYAQSNCFFFCLDNEVHNAQIMSVYVAFIANLVRHFIARRRIYLSLSLSLFHTLPVRDETNE